MTGWKRLLRGNFPDTMRLFALGRFPCAFFFVSSGNFLQPPHGEGVPTQVFAYFAMPMPLQSIELGDRMMNLVPTHQLSF